jgi:hypothetical protein
VVAGGGDDQGTFLERAADGAAGAGGVLQDEPAARLVEGGTQAGGDGLDSAPETPPPGLWVSTLHDLGAHGLGPPEGGG